MLLKFYIFSFIIALLSIPVYESIYGFPPYHDNSIPVPHMERKRALVLIDLQTGNVNNHNRWIIPNIRKIISGGKYACIVTTRLHAAKGSVWEQQMKRTFPLNATVPEIKSVLPKNHFEVIKTTRSAFKGHKDLDSLLRGNNIVEIHIAGLNINDCVMATAQEAFDRGYYAYVIEECCESSSDKLRKSSLRVLRHLKMTNHSTE